MQGELTGTGVSVWIAYLGFTENDAAKRILNRRGNLMRQPARPFVEPTPVPVVVEQIVQMIRNRRQSRYIGYPGPIVAWLNWLAPNFCLWYVRKAYRKHIRNPLPATNRQRSQESVAKNGFNQNVRVPPGVNRSGNTN